MFRSFGWVGAVIVMGFLNVAAARPLDKNLENIAVLPAETKKGDIFYPELELGEKLLVAANVAVKNAGGVYIAVPTDANSDSRSIYRVYLNENGGVYFTDPQGSKAATRYLRLAVEKKSDPLAKSERNFLRQFAYLLSTRHADDLATEKFLEFHFNVTRSGGNPKALINLQDALTIPGASPIPGKPNTPEVISYLQNPGAWTPIECSDKQCVYEHATLGKFSFESPGPKDLVLDEIEVKDPNEEVFATAPEVKNKPEVDKILSSTDASIQTVYILISHEECGPCKTLKSISAGGVWASLCKRLKKKQLEKIQAYVENAHTANFAPSNLMSEYKLKQGYPQLLVFRRNTEGAWGVPEIFAGKELTDILSKH